MKIVIIGGVAGGASTATRLRRLDENAEIILFEKGQYISYANCGLPYYIGDTIKDRNKLFVQTPEGFENRFNIEVRTQQEVIGIDTANKTVSVKRLKSGETYTKSYDKLVLSPGAEPICPPIKGIDSKRVFKLRSVPDTDKIKGFINDGNIKTAVVVGGGFIGLEMAENLHQLGIKVTVIERAEQVMTPLDFSMAAIVHQHLVDKNIRLLLNEGVSGFEETTTNIKVELNSGNVLDTDMVIWSIGVRPDIKLAKEAGLTIGTLGGISVNAHLQTSNPDIYAVGDAIEVINPITSKPALIPLAGPANKQGRIAANNIVNGNKEEYKGTIATAIAKVFDLTVASAGSSAKLLKRDGVAFQSSYTHSSSHAGYYPNSLPLSIKIMFAPHTGQLLGAQVVGCDGVDKRIEMLAQVIKHKGTIYELCELEHAYAPPYSSAKDPVNMVGFVAENIITGKMKPLHWRELDKASDFLLDVRTIAEFKLGHIDGAINIPLDELRLSLDSVPKNRRVVIYCAIGLRGYLAYRILAQSGFTNIVNLSGGYKTYSVANAPVINNETDCSKTNCGEQIMQTNNILEVDACGLQCPGPIVKLKEAYSSLQEGQQLRITATDPAFKKDVAAWCNVTGAKLVNVDIKSGIVTACIDKGEKICSMATANGDGKTIVVFSDDLDKALASFVIANGAASMGKKVSMFFTFWGLNVIKKAKKPKVEKDLMGKMFGMMLPSSSKKLKLSKLNMFGMGRRMMRSIMKKKNIDSLESLIEQAKASGVEFIACTMSMDVMGVKQEELMEGVNLGGVASYLERAEEANMSLFI